jgi:hypothetical protein
MRDGVGPYRFLRNHVRRYPILLRILAKARGKSQMIVQKGKTQVCIEGYLRSANSTSTRLFRIANPDCEIAHHNHMIANVKMAVRGNVPTIILLRDPVDAICSALIFAKTRKPVDELLRYVSYYHYVEQHLDAVVMVEFKSALEDFNRAIERLNRHFGTHFHTIDDLAEANRQVEQDIRERYATMAEGSDVTNMPLPSEERRRIKERWRSQVEAHPMLEEARAVYGRLLPRCFDSDSQCLPQTSES